MSEPGDAQDDKWTIVTVDVGHIRSVEADMWEEEYIFDLEPGYKPVIEEYEDENGFELHVKAESEDAG